jgi:hypothetical protein
MQELGMDVVENDLADLPGLIQPAILLFSVDRDE